MMVGLPSSGKSTYALEYANLYHATVVSSDNIRKEMFGDINDQNHNVDVFEEAHKRIICELSNCNNVVFDATNINYKRRKVLIEEINKFNCKKICNIVAVPYFECLCRNNLRNRKVPEDVIKRMYLNFYMPQYYEGWDKIYYIWNIDFNTSVFNTHTLFSDINGLDNINQDNPHHTLTIGYHCKMCSKICELYKSDKNVVVAGLYHDIGKKFTKVFKNYKGELTDIAHYYNHMNVSAYDAMFYLKQKGYNDDDILDICNLIQWHMRPFDIKTDKARDKFIRLVGKKFYDRLMILHQADIEAK